jgi:hypothetical protein
MKFEAGKIYTTDMGGGFTMIQGARTDTHGWSLLLNEGKFHNIAADVWLTTTGRPTVELAPVVEAKQEAA